jgi:O-antigen/teichoic acid export membrane protein
MASAAIGSGLLVALAQTALFPVPTGRLFHLGAIILLPKAASGIMAGFINGRQRMDVTSSIAVTVRLLTLAGAIPALAGGFSVGGVLVCTAAAEVVGVLGYGLVLRSWHLLPGPRLAPSRWRTILSEAYPFALTGIIAMAYRRLDIVLLSAWRGDAAAGQYGAAYGLWEAVGMVPSSLLDAMFPEMARLAGERAGIRRLRRVRRRTRPLLMIVGLLISAAGSALAGTLMTLVYGPTQGQEVAVAAFRLQVWAIPAMFLYLLNGHALYALGRQRWVTAAMTIVGLLTVGLNLLVIPRWSVLGVSAVALCSAWLLWVLLSVLAGRAFRAEEDAR